MALEAIVDARLGILTAFEVWTKTNPQARLEDSLRRFTAAYNAEEVDVESHVRRELPRLSVASLRRWRTRRQHYGWQGLIPKSRARRDNQRLIDVDIDVSTDIAGLLFEHPRASSTFIMQVIRARYGADRTPKRRALQRYMARFRADHERTLSALTDPDRHRSRYMPDMGRADAGIERLNQVWEADSTSADVQCTDGAFHLIVIVDVYSRRARVLITPTSRATAIVALLRRCILDWGVPEIWRSDQGPDYMSRHVLRVLSDLKITLDECEAYNPDGKPFVERFIRTISHGLFEYLPGFKGHSIAEQQSLRARFRLADRRGKDAAKIFGVALSSDELQTKCDEWIHYVYEHGPHGGLSERTPFDVATSWRSPVRTVSNERALDLLLAPPAGGDGWRVVSQSGIHVDNCCYIASALGNMVRERVHVRRDPTDLGRILVFDSDGEFVCCAEDPECLGIDRREHAARAKAIARKADREGKEYARELIRNARVGEAMDDVLSAQERDFGNVVALPSRAAEHRTPALISAERAAAESERPKLADTDTGAQGEILRVLRADAERREAGGAAETELPVSHEHRPRNEYLAALKRVLGPDWNMAAG